MTKKGEVLTTSKVSEFLEKQLSKSFPDEIKLIQFITPQFKNNNIDVIDDEKNNNDAANNNSALLDGYFDFIVIVDLNQSMNLLQYMIVNVIN